MGTHMIDFAISQRGPHGIFFAMESKATRFPTLMLTRSFPKRCCPLAVHNYTGRRCHAEISQDLLLLRARAELPQLDPSLPLPAVRCLRTMLPSSSTARAKHAAWIAETRQRAHGVISSTAHLPCSRNHRMGDVPCLPGAGTQFAAPQGPCQTRSSFR